MKTWNELKYLKNRIKRRYCKEYAKKLCNYLDICRKYKGIKKIKAISGLSNSIMQEYHLSIYYTQKGYMCS